jgi:transposase-like protein
MARRTHVRYTPEFKAEALRIVRQSNDSLSKIAKDLGVTEKSLHAWVKAARSEPREPLTEDERDELQRLRRENRRLQMERDILKKATLFSTGRRNDLR